MQKRRANLVLGMIFFMFLITLVSTVSAASISTTDVFGNVKTDFSPEETVFIHGQGFSLNSIIKINVTRPDSVVNTFFTISDITGKFVTSYQLDGIKGVYNIYSTDGIHNAQITFTDAAIWTTDNSFGLSQQDVNHYPINGSVFINGDGFSLGNYSWNIKGLPGGASCDPNQVVASGIQFVNSSGAFCFNAYTIPNGDCGEYQVKFEQKGDNYRVEGNTCTNSSQCGTPSSDISCVDTSIKNVTITPQCVNDTCVLTNVTTIKSCGNLTSQLSCVGNNVTNTTVVPSCSINQCLNLTVETVVQTCEFGCSNNQCNNQTQFCGNGIKEGSEQCDDGNEINNDSCTNQCKDPACGDGIVQAGVGETCEPPNTLTCNSQCHTTQCPNIDSDHDGVLDCDDMCPNSKRGEPVDENGCDIFQFCSKKTCGIDCLTADFKGNEQNVIYPHDCTIVIPEREGKIQQPICTPTVFSDLCAG